MSETKQPEVPKTPVDQPTPKENVKPTKKRNLLQSDDEKEKTPQNKKKVIKIEDDDEVEFVETKKTKRNDYIISNGMIMERVPNASVVMHPKAFEQFEQRMTRPRNDEFEDDETTTDGEDIENTDNELESEEEGEDLYHLEQFGSLSNLNNFIKKIDANHEAIKFKVGSVISEQISLKAKEKMCNNNSEIEVLRRYSKSYIKETMAKIHAMYEESYGDLEFFLG